MAPVRSSKSGERATLDVLHLILNIPLIRSVVARNNDILKKLVLEAKREYEKDAEHRVHIFMADT